MTRSPVARWLPLAAAAVALVYVSFMLAATSGHFVPQVVDLYVIAQYARAWAEGHPFQYNAGEPASTGATSLLWTLVLGLGHFLGARGEGLVAFAVALGSGCYVVSVWLAERLGRVLAGAQEGALAGGLVLLSGPIVWAYLYGSDTAPFMLAALWLFERLVSGSMRGVAIAGVLLALLRPEGLLIALLLLAWGLRRTSAARERLLLLAPVLAGCGWLLLNRGLTGYWLSTSVTDKALVTNYGWPASIALVTEYATEVVRGLFLGLYPSTAPMGASRGWASYYFPPLGLAIALVGLFGLPAPRRSAAFVWATIAVVVSVALLPNMFMGVHFHRYLLWAFPGLHVLIAVGLGVAARFAARGDERASERIFRIGAGLFLVLGALSTARFAVQYGDQAGEVFRRDVAAASWIKAHLPAGARIANVATSIEYLTGHWNVNLHGVTSPAFFGNHTAEREAGMWEALARLPETERPEYLLATQSGLESSQMLPPLVLAPPLYQSLSLGDELVLHRLRYDLVGRQKEMHSPEALAATRGLREVDRLNVGDSRDEAAHDYRYASAVGDVRLHGALGRATYADGFEVMDAGRAIFGSEALTIHADPQAELVIILRTRRTAEANVFRASSSVRTTLDIASPRLEVTVADRPPQVVTFEPTVQWQDVVIRVPPSHAAPAPVRLAIRGRYAAFHFWFFQ